MKTKTAQLTVLALALAVQQVATAGLTATIVDSVVGPGKDPNSITVYGTQNWDIAIKLNATTGVAMMGLQLRLQEITLGDSPSGKFQLNSVTFGNPSWDPPPPAYQWPDYQWSSDSEYHWVVPSLPQELNLGRNYTSDVIGNLSADEVNGTDPGEFYFATLNITLSDPEIGADYYLNLFEIVYGDTNFDDKAGAAPTPYHVQVIPAPGAFVLGMIGLGMLGWVRRVTGR